MTHKAGGTGLGLAIVRQTLLAHDGARGGGERAGRRDDDQTIPAGGVAGGHDGDGGTWQLTACGSRSWRSSVFRSSRSAMPIARAFARRLESKPPAAIPPDVSARLERIEQAVDAIAIEMERISEGQRFTTKLLAERAAAPSRAGAGAADAAAERASDVERPDRRRRAEHPPDGRRAARAARATRCATPPKAPPGSQRVAESEPDVVLLDLMMPGRAGRAGDARAAARAVPDVPVVMMSGSAGLERRGEGDEARRVQLPREAAHRRRACCSRWRRRSSCGGRGARRGRCARISGSPAR